MLMVVVVVVVVVRSIVLNKERVDAIRSGWTPDVCKVTNGHKTYKMDHFMQVCGRHPTPSTPDYTASGGRGVHPP